MTTNDGFTGWRKYMRPVEIVESTAPIADEEDDIEEGSVDEVEEVDQEEQDGEVVDDEHDEVSERCSSPTVRATNSRRLAYVWAVFFVMIALLATVAVAVDGKNVTCFSCLSKDGSQCRRDEVCTGKFCLKITQTFDSDTSMQTVMRRCHSRSDGLSSGECVQGTSSSAYDGVQELTCLCDTDKCNDGVRVSNYISGIVGIIVALLFCSN